MATNIEVIYLGFSGTEIDTTESDTVSESANLLVGTSYGSAGSPLYDNIQNLSPNSVGPIYDTDNNFENDPFTADGTMYILDGAAIYLATVTYADGTTAQLEVTVVQASSGDLFLLPPTFGGEDQQAILEAGPIETLTLDSLVSNTVQPIKDRIDIDFAGAVDGTGGSDDMTLGYLDADGDQAGAGNDLLFGNGGADTIEGGGGSDVIEGGTGNDVIYGDTADGSTYGTLNPTNSDNFADSGGTETFNTRAVELVTLANGDLIMITSERGSSDAGIASYRIDNDPDSATYGQILGSQIDTESASVNGDGYRDIEDMAAVTLSNGETYLYTADHQGDAIGITRINSDGTLANQPPMTDGSGNNQFDDVQELSIATVDGTHFLLSLGGGSDGGINDALIVHQVGADGSLTQTDIEVDGNGASETFLNNNGPTDASLLESFTDSNGNTFVIAGGADDGISLWTLNSSGQLTFQNAREDDAAGAGETDPQGNDLGRDLISPGQTGLWHVDAGTFGEINGQVYLFVGGMDDDVVMFRVDPDAVNNDGTFDLTLVGQLDNPVTDISSMTFLPTDDGGSLVVGAETSGLRFYDVTVNPDGTVSLTLGDTIANGAGAQLADVEDIDVEGGLLVTASDDDDGVTLIDTGLKPEAQIAGDDQIDAGAGNDSVYAGGGNDTITLADGFGDDVIFGGEDADSTDVDVLDASGITGSGITVTMSSGESGTLINGADSADFGEIEDIVFTDQGDVFNGNFVTDDLDVNTGAGDDTLTEGNGNNTLTGGAGNDIFNVGFGDSTIFGGIGTDTLSGAIADDPLDVLFSGSGVGTYTDLDGIPDQGIFDGIEAVAGSSGADTINAGADLAGVDLSGLGGSDTIFGGAGDDTISGGADNDLLVGGSGADSILGGTGNDVLVGGNNGNSFPISGDQAATGGDTLDGGAGNDTIYGNTGSDTLLGGDDNDLLFGEWGNDSLDGGAGADTLDGAAGNDTLSGGAGNDLLTGGDGNDTFQYTTGGGLDTISDFNTGNTGALADGNSTNNDFIDLSGHYDHLFELWADQYDDGVLNQSNAFDTQGNAVDYSDNTQFDTDGTPGNEGIVFTNAVADQSYFNVDNTGVICFAAGTLIDTPRGPVLVERLSTGDLVRTVDRGYQPLIWASHTTHSWTASEHDDKPILIKANALGPGMPKADLKVSPQHRILLADSEHAEGVFARAKSLVGLPGVRQMRGCRAVSYHHLMLDRHDVLFANGLPSESFFPGPAVLRMLSGANRSSLLRCLMKLSSHTSAMPFRLARNILKSRAVNQRVKQGRAIWNDDLLYWSGCLAPRSDAFGSDGNAARSG